MSDLKRCFVTYQPTGKGVQNDPCRRLVCFHDYETLEIFHAWDEWADNERLAIQKEESSHIE